MIDFGFFDDDTKAQADALGKTIASATIDFNAGDAGEFYLRFTDGTGVRIWDGGQSCCEHRYLTCDDNLDHLRGMVLRDLNYREGLVRDEGGDVHEIGFVDIVYDAGQSVVLTTHNEHNGYYGGFCVRADALPKVEPISVEPRSILRSTLRLNYTRKLQLD
jgi:hypothetical protein